MKKILQDEILSDEELEKVSGGKVSQIADDSRFLNSLNGSTDRYGDVKIYFDVNRTKKSEIAGAWSALGIEAKLSRNLVDDNKYFLNGQEISQEQARQHAMKVTGHYMEESDWNW